MRNFLLNLIFLSPIVIHGQTWFTTGQNADLMVSGVDFNNTGGALLFNHPNGLASNGTNLLMCDRFNNRILIWNNAPTVWNTSPDIVLGQPNFTANNPGTNKNQMNWPGNVSVAANGKLVVADTGNDRVLLWNSFPTSNGQYANISIHLPTISPTNIPLKWAWPWGVWTDGTRVAAVATMGRTILFWNSFPVSDNQQPDYTITNANFGTPRNISTDGATYFFVGDHNAQVNGNPGTFFWNSYPSITNQPYNFYRNEWIKGTKLTSGQLIASGLSHIYTWNTMPTNSGSNPNLSAAPSCYDNGDGVDVVGANGRIYVCNYNGNSVLVYNSPPDSLNPNPVFAMGISNYNNNTLDSIGYIQNPSFSTDGTRLIITSDYDKRIYIYNTFPTSSGQMASQVISTQSYDLAPWDNALYNNTFVAAGKNRVCVWNNAMNLSANPSQIFNGNIGSATLNDLKGIALDNRFFYLSDRSGNVYIWNGIPANNSVNPVYTLNLGNVQLNRLSSDGTYFCVTQQSPGAIYIYKVAALAIGNTTPWKTISGIGFLNLPSETITFNGSLAIANSSFNDVLLWKDINDAPDTDSIVVLGNNSNSSSNNPAIGINRLFMPGALLYENNHLWVGEHKFSSRVLRFASQSTTGTSDINIIIYPNPATNELNITGYNLDDQGILQYNFIDCLGRTLMSGKSSEKNLKISISNLPKGVYLVKLKGNIWYTQKVIKD